MKSSMRTRDGSCWSLHNRLPRQSPSIWFPTHSEVNLGRDDHSIPLGKVPQCATEDLFAGAARVRVRRVEEVDPQFDGAPESRSAQFRLEVTLTLVAVGDSWSLDCLNSAIWNLPTSIRRPLPKGFIRRWERRNLQVLESQPRPRYSGMTICASRQLCV